MRFGAPTLKAELASLTFARVTNIRLGKRGEPVPDDPKTPIAHFYGFAKDVHTNATIWFKKLTHTRAAGRPGVYVGPAKLAATVHVLRDLPKRGQILVGRTSPSPKGLAFDWWCSQGAPVLALERSLRTGKVREKNYNDFAICDSDAPDDVWALACLVLNGDVGLLADELRAPSRRRRHPASRGEGFQAQRGLNLTLSPRKFVFHAAEFVREHQLLARFDEYCKAKKITDTSEDAEDPTLTLRALEKMIA